ncbi:bromodomain-containing protein 8 isoform X2 [Oryzias latipes]
MASGAGKHKLLVIGPTEPWTVREKLCLATSVMKSGDQNWVSVSRAIKPFAEPGRPPDWFSQKHCASKYSELLETTEAPKRKRGEKGEVVETIEDVIVRRLTAERIEELKRFIKETQEKHRQLKREAELIQAGHLDSKLEELWHEILRKKKQEEEEAELNRKNTDAAFQARQVAKSMPKRTSSVTMNSPSACGSPSQELPPGDPAESLTLDATSTNKAPGAVRFMTLAETSGPENDLLVQGDLLDNSTQKQLFSQKATPSLSPLLSELLKKGNILATNSRLVVEGNMSAGHMTGSHDPQLTPTCQHLSQATGAPMLSRLLEAGPSQFSPSDGFMTSAGSASSAAVSAACPDPVPASSEADVTPQSYHAVPAQQTGAEVSEEDVTLSYLGDELDMKTVGDIIAIIEEKANEAAEALDAAAVEAALSLCEENGHALPAGWDSGPFQPRESQDAETAAALQPSSLYCSMEAGSEASLICNSKNNCLAGFPLELRSPPPVPLSSCNSKTLERCQSSPSMHSEAQTPQRRDTKEPAPEDSTVKCESYSEAPENNDRDSKKEDSPSVKGQQKEAEDRKDARNEENAPETKAESSVEEPEVCGEEEGYGIEGFLSEPDGDLELQPAASESEDGCSLHTASSSLQLHAVADSIPSSPASSQFSVCSEDLEALQAHRIWKKAIMLVWRAAANHRYANVFLQPVTDEIAPGYHRIVHRPMDLATLKKNIETGLIRTTAEFQRDIMLMFQNAVMYNGLDHDVYHMALEMQRDVMEQIQQFLATQLIMETSESGISSKSLRGRESTHKQDSTDKDTVSMSSPAFLLSLFDGGTRGRRSAIQADLKMKK